MNFWDKKESLEDKLVEKIQRGELSIAELECLSYLCAEQSDKQRGVDLSEVVDFAQPTYAQAISAGIEDKSYRTVRHGLVNNYAGRAVVTVNGVSWMCTGHSARGDAFHVTQQGYIHFERLKYTVAESLNAVDWGLMS